MNRRRPLLSVLPGPPLSRRRSAVSRQSCHLLGTLAAVLGGRFEPYALHFLPELFKGVVITVHIMAESADVCAHAILRHCHSPRLLPRICDAAARDRAAKLRQCCCEYLLQVRGFGVWDSG